MKSTPLLAALLLLLACNTHSQVTLYDISNYQVPVTAYDISTYKLPDITWQALETSFGFMGDNGFKNSFQGNTTSSENQTSIFSGNLNLDYRYFRNTESKQRLVRAGVASNLYFQKISINEATLRSRAYNPQIFLYSENRMYFRNQLFYETNLDLGYSHNYQKEKRETDVFGPEIQSVHSLAIAIPLKIGSGRIEPVQDARQAIYILEELTRVGRLDGNITDEEVVELAQLISKLRNKRFLDTRLGWMEQIETLDSLLLANDHINLQDARYFTTLADMWNYGNFPQRSSGNRISLALYPKYILNDYHSSLPNEIEDTDSQTKTFQLNTGIEFVHEKPLNLYWQNSIYAHAYFKYHTRQSTNTFDTRSPGMEIMLAHQIGFYPNTRTQMILNNSLTYDNTNQKIKDGTHREFNNLIFDSSLGIEYYFSPQLRIGGHSRISYNRKRQSYSNIDIEPDPFKQRSFSHRFNVEVIYKIF